MLGLRHHHRNKDRACAINAVAFAWEPKTYSADEMSIVFKSRFEPKRDSIDDARAIFVAMMVT